jgi:hypothetical protein
MRHSQASRPSQGDRSATPSLAISFPIFGIIFGNCRKKSTVVEEFTASTGEFFSFLSVLVAFFLE